MMPKVGDRVRMTGVMPNDPAPMEVGAEGTVTVVWETGGDTLPAQIGVDWDNGRSLMLLPTDPFEVTGHVEETPSE